MNWIIQVSSGFQHNTQIQLQKVQPPQGDGSGTRASGTVVSDRRSGFISDPEAWTQNQTYSIAGDSDSEEKQTLKELLARIVKLEQKNEAYEEKLTSYEQKIDELQRKKLELEQANQPLQAD